LEDDTIVVFTSDHACHFRSRNAEYKRSPHESSIHIPLIVQGPGFNRAMEVNELVSQVDLAPTLLDAASIPVPRTMQGHSALPLLARKMEGLKNEVYIEISESLKGRALRTPQWTYAVAVPARQQFSTQYNEYMLYDRFADPFQQVNLAGRMETREVSAHLRERPISRIVQAGDPKPVISPPYIPCVRIASPAGFGLSFEFRRGYYSWLSRALVPARLGSRVRPDLS
jgi:arylsulfatase A-like enzyme